MNSTQNISPIVSKIVNKWQITVPGEIRALYGLKEGDVFEWRFNPQTSALTLVPKRAQLINPIVKAQVDEVRTRRNEKKKEPAYA